MPRNPKDIAAHSTRTGDTETHYDANWHVVGHTKYDGQTETHFDKNWNKLGYTKHDGTDETHFDRDWKVVGHTTRTEKTESHFNKNWRLVGHTKRDRNGRTHFDRAWRLLRPDRKQQDRSTYSGGGGGGGGGGDGGKILALIVLGILLPFILAAIALVLPVYLLKEMVFKRSHSHEHTVPDRQRIAARFGLGFLGLICLAVGETLKNLIVLSINAALQAPPTTKYNSTTGFPWLDNVLAFLIVASEILWALVFLVMGIKLIFRGRLWAKTQTDRILHIH